MAYKDLRAFIEYLEKEGELLRIKEELDPRYEISAIFRGLGQREGPALLIERVKGYGIPLVGNLLGSRKRIALALETNEDDCIKEYEKRSGEKIPPLEVKAASVKDVILKEKVDIFKTIPVLTYHQRDASPYITQGIVFSKDPETGQRSMGIHRLQVKGGNRLGVYISEYSPTLGKFFANAEKRGKPLEVAIAIGVDPALLITASSILLAPGSDKLELAGGLRREGLEVTKGETVDLEVPANAMFIIEGRIPPGVRELDGPFGESSGYYIPSHSPVIEITAITHQKNPIYAVFQPFSLDDVLFFNTIWKNQISKFLKSVIPSIREVFLSYPGGFLVMSIEKRNEWDARHALYTSLTLLLFVKYAIVVDSDIDVSDPKEVGWALSGRCQLDRDLVLLKDVCGDPLDPSVKKGNITTKIGLDATKPLDGRERFERIAVPQDAALKAAEILKKYLRED